jgi:hypothetical protein
VHGARARGAATGSEKPPGQGRRQRRSLARGAERRPLAATRDHYHRDDDCN